MADLQCHFHFNSSSVISGRWKSDTEKLKAMTPFTKENISALATNEPGTARSAEQYFLTELSGAPTLYCMVSIAYLLSTCTCIWVCGGGGRKNIFFS